MTDQGDDGPHGEGGVDFARRLQELKERGCAVLVTGDSAADVHTEICRRLLGDDSVGRRRRLLVFTNGTFGLDARLPASGLRGEDTEVITTSNTRSAVVESVPTSTIGVVELDDASLEDLGLAIVEAIESFEESNGPLEPAELRFGLDSLCPLLDAHGEHAVFEFLTIVTRYLRAYDALGHVHLPVERDAYVARLLAPLFEAVVEVRVRDGQKQQRWHLDDGAVTSRWLSI